MPFSSLPNMKFNIFTLIALIAAVAVAVVTEPVSDLVFEWIDEHGERQQSHKEPDLELLRHNNFRFTTRSQNDDVVESTYTEALEQKPMLGDAVFAEQDYGLEGRDNPTTTKSV